MGACCAREARLALMAWIVFFILNCAFLAGPCVYYFGMQKNMWFVTVIFVVLVAYVGLNFAMATFMDPGVFPRATSEEAHTYDPVSEQYKVITSPSLFLTN